MNWLNCDSHLNRYKPKVTRKCGKASSVDIETVKEEQARIRGLLAGFRPEDCWNVDETSLYAFDPPIHGLSQRGTSGQRASESRITLCFACNADGSQKRDLFFIGKPKESLCFDQHGPTANGFYYRSHEKTWMTKSLFEE